METWLETAAERFWTAADRPEPFPRNLEDAIALALPVMVARLPRLGLFSAERWLSQYSPRFIWSAPERGGRGDRRLRACLVADDENGCILLDAADPPDEQRYSLAHEVAHFILDYQQPRQLAQRRLGGAALAVLDGRRPASDSERIEAALAGVTLGAHLHLMERGPTGVEAAAIARAEADADRLALQLLAPEDHALAVLPTTGCFAERLTGGTAALIATFGLPAAVAAPFARRLITRRDGPPGWYEWLE